MDDKNSLKTKRCGFVERWAKAEEKASFLGITLYALIVFSMALLVTVFIVSTKPQAIYYIPGAESAGVAYPNRMDKTVITSFAQNWLLNRNNFTPLTVRETYERTMRFMAPELLSRTRASLEEEISRVTRDNISSLFSLKSEPEFLEEGDGYKVALTGEKALYMGKERLDSRSLRYTLTLKHVPPIEANPYGLLIAGVKQEEAGER